MTPLIVYKYYNLLLLNLPTKSANPLFVKKIQFLILQIQFLNLSPRISDLELVVT